MRRYIAAFCAAALLSACGGGGGAPTPEAPPVAPNQPAEPPPVAPHQAAKPLSADVNDNGNFLGIGPAFGSQSPDIHDLPAGTEFARDSIRIRSGRSRDAQGRDGSATAAEVVRFLKAFQTQAYRESGPDARLVFIDFGEQKTLRIGSTASQRERRLVRAALRNINTALPWANRILLGPDITERLAAEDIPDGEIHIHFTDGKGSWPEYHEDDEDEDVRILGIGGANSEELTVLSGYTYIDREAVGGDDTRMEFVITHELLHAYGIVAHVDPDAYPDSLLVPHLPRNLDAVPRIYLTLDGEALLAEIRIDPGIPVSDLTAADFGPWEETGFHLLGWAELGGVNASVLQFGAGYRNGLGKPWAYGQIPSTQLQDSPDLSGRQRATWRGSLLGFTGAGRTVSGDAEIGINLRHLQGSADFTELESWAPETHPGTPGSGRLWGDGDLGYTIAVRTEAGTEAFVSTFAPGDDPGVVTGAFVGTAHEGAAGVLEHPDLSAAFGATR